MWSYKKGITIFLLCLFIAIAGYTQEIENTNVESARYGYLKISPLPLLFPYFQKSRMKHWIIVQYESQFGSKGKFTYSIGVDLRLFEESSYNNNYKSHYIGIRPEVRYYFGKQAFHGFYGGLFPFYRYENGENLGQINAYGLGVVTGYQHFIGNVPLEFSVGLGYGPGKTTPSATPPYVWPYLMTVFEINVGLPIREKK